jgi:hypothetical protein
MTNGSVVHGEFRVAEQRGLEGVVSKRRDASIRPQQALRHIGVESVPSPRRPRIRLAAPSFALFGFQGFHGLLHGPWRNMDYMS